jgi:hypothetical protein
VSSVERADDAGTRSAQTVPPLPGMVASQMPLATPRERRWGGIPAAGGLLEPGDNLLGRVRMLAIERAPFQDTLERLGHVEPAAAQRGVEHHDPVRKEPQHQLERMVAAQIVPDQQQAQGGNSAGSVIFTCKPACQHVQHARLAAASLTGAGSGKVASTAVNSSLSQVCKVVFGQVVTPLTCITPVAGRSNVSSLAVPRRTYSCGCWTGCACGTQVVPGYGRV